MHLFANPVTYTYMTHRFHVHACWLYISPLWFVVVLELVVDLLRYRVDLYHLSYCNTLHKQVVDQDTLLEALQMQLMQCSVRNWSMIDGSLLTMVAVMTDIIMNTYEYPFSWLIYIIKMV